MVASVAMAMPGCAAARGWVFPGVGAGPVPPAALPAPGLVHLTLLVGGELVVSEDGVNEFLVLLVIVRRVEPGGVVGPPATRGREGGAGVARAPGPALLQHVRRDATRPLPHERRRRRLRRRRERATLRRRHGRRGRHEVVFVERY